MIDGGAIPPRGRGGSPKMRKVVGEADRPRSALPAIHVICRQPPERLSSSRCNVSHTETAGPRTSGLLRSPSRLRNSMASLMAFIGSGWWHLSQTTAFRARGLTDIELPQKHLICTVDPAVVVLAIRHSLLITRDPGARSRPKRPWRHCYLPCSLGLCTLPMVRFAQAGTSPHIGVGVT